MQLELKGKVNAHKIKLASFISIWFLIIAAFSCLIIITNSFDDISVSAATIVVDQSGGGNYKTIQEAINAAKTGDTVLVNSGTYNESIVVNRTINLVGKGPLNSIISGKSSTQTVKIESDNVNISGFKIIHTQSLFVGNGIYLTDAANCRISNNTISDNYRGIYGTNSNKLFVYNNSISHNSHGGVRMQWSSDGTYINNFITKNGRCGIWIYGKNTILNNTLINNDATGIEISQASYNRIYDNTIVNNSGYGISLSGFSSIARNNVIKNNTFSKNLQGISLYGAESNFIIDNNLDDHIDLGFYISNSKYISVFNNSLINDGIRLLGDLVHFNTHNITLNNTVNSKPMYYYQNKSSLVIDNIPVGQLILANCTDSVINNLTISNTTIPIFVAYSKNISLQKNNLTRNKDNGLNIHISDGCRLTGNTITMNKNHGMVLYESQNHFVTGNFLMNNSAGIHLNRVSNCNLSGNAMVNEGIYILGGFRKHYISHQISPNNSVNGKPVYYFKNYTGLDIDGMETGQLILVNCTDSVVKNLTINNTNIGITMGYCEYNNVTMNEISGCDYFGIHAAFSDSNNFTYNKIFSNDDGYYLYFSFENKIEKNNISSNSASGIDIYSTEKNLMTGNNITNNNNGIWISSSNYNMVIGNNITRNTGYGIYVMGSTKSQIHHNNFINNTISGHDTYNNYWDNGYPDGGNYWSDYTGHDEGGLGKVAGDGIGDTPYDVDEDTYDNYPFMKPFGWLYPGTPVLSGPTGVDIDGDYTISWKATRNILEYILEEITGEDNSTAKQIYNGTDLSVEFKDKPNGTYYYRAKTYNENYISDWSNTIKVVVDWIPKPASGLTATNPTGNSVTLNWTAPTENDIQGYYILVNNTGAGAPGPFHQIKIVSNTTKLMVITNLISETTYYFVVVVFDNNHNSSYSNVASSTTIDNIAPASPVGFNALAFSKSVINLGWTPNSEPDFEGYHIFMNDTDSGPSGQFHLIYNSVGTGNSYTVTGLSEQVEYHFKLRAYDDVPNYSPFSDVVSATTLDQTAPGAPSDLSAIPLSDSEIFLNWDPDPAPDIEGYKVFMNKTNSGAGGQFYEIQTLLGKHSSYKVTGLSEQVTYHFKMQAYDEVPNISGYSNVASATTIDIKHPSRPTGVVVSDPTISTLTISWNPNPENDIEGYMVYRSLSIDQHYSQVTSEPVDKTQYRDEGLEEYTTYYYQVKAIDDYGLESMLSEIVSGTTLLGPYPPHINNSINDFTILEDSFDDSTINLYHWFADRNDDKLSFRVSGEEMIEVTIYQNNGTVTLRPGHNWNGKETLTFYASDGKYEISDEVVIKVRGVNDPPGNVKIIQPEDGIVIEEGDFLDFVGNCTDPDEIYGDVLHFEWSSNMSLIRWSGEHSENIMLGEGTHQITLTVIDKNELSSSASIIITVKGKEKPPVIEDKDKDNDGIPDAWENSHGLNPADPLDSDKDFDFDGLSNFQEFKIGSNPNEQDTDNDGLNDGIEFNILKTNATNPDTDSDGHNDGVDAYPLDPLKWKKKSSEPEGYGGIMLVIIAIIIVLVVIVILFLFVIKPRFGNRGDGNSKMESGVEPSGIWQPQQTHQLPPQPDHEQFGPPAVEQRSQDYRYPPNRL